MMLRSAAVVAGLALGLMSGAAKAAQVPTTYMVDYTVSDRFQSQQVTGYIKTDGATNRALTSADILDFSINSGGLSANNFTLYGAVLTANMQGNLQFDFSKVGALKFQILNNQSNTDVADFFDFGPGSTTAYAYPNVQQNFNSGDVFTIGTAAVSSVPLPASAPMFGAALLGLAGIGYAAKRKKAATAA